MDSSLTKKKRCKICHKSLKNSKALGGHMTWHNNKNRKAAKAAAGKAGKRAKRPFSAIGRLLARNRSRLAGGAGGNLPLPPVAPKTGTISTLGRILRVAANNKLQEAAELQKMAQRLEELL